jgi:glutathione S-transferase
MKLYYAPGVCSLASHITLNEAGLAHALEKVDLGKKITETGADYTKVNPNGYVPALELDGGEVLTEGPAILQYLADLAPASGLAPAAGSIERVRLQQWLNFITSELHKGYSPLFNSDPTVQAAKPVFRKKLADRFAHVDRTLADGRAYLTGEAFTVADAYLFTVANWARLVDLDLSGLSHLQALLARIAERPAVQKTLAAEGLKKAA